MAETAIHGTLGSITWAGHGGRLMQFEITTVQDVNDCSGFGLATNWRSNLPGMKGWRVRGSGYMVRDATGNAPAADFTVAGDSAAGITFTGTISSTATACTYTGMLIASSFVLATGINGNATYQFEGVGTGALVETWDVS